MFNLKRKVLFGVSVSMVLAMAIGSFALGENQTPASPMAVETQSEEAINSTGLFNVTGGTEGVNYSYANSVLTIYSGNLTISTNGETTERIVLGGAATITFAGVNISAASGPALQIQDDATFNVNILLADGSTNILKGKAGRTIANPGSPGIQKNGSGDGIGTLTIGVPDGSTGTGKLEAAGGYAGAGIGSGKDKSTSKITITGGVVTATGGSSGAGIGGGYSSSGSNITINGGEVNVTAHDGGAGIGGGRFRNGSNITINGGKVTASTNSGAGIGGGAEDGSGINITINGGVVTATGGSYGAGIGSGNQGNGSNIIINGGEVTANGGVSGAGIGGGQNGSGSDITIKGGVVTATGGSEGAGIGDGSSPRTSGSGNSLNGDAVVLATSGSTTKAALEGFADSDLNRGITFTRQTTSGTWSGTMYGNSVKITEDVEFPADLTISANKQVTVGENTTLTIPANVTLTTESGARLTVANGATLKNDGTVIEGGTVVVSGTITTKTDFYREGSTDVYTTGYQTYRTSAGVQKYTNLLNPDNSNDTVFDSWFTKPGGPDGGGTKVDENTNVLLNEHSFYEHRVVAEYTITVADLENGSITPDVTEAAKDDIVTLTVTPAEGYQLKEGSLTVTDADGNEVPVTEQDGKYTFTMPGADVTVSAAFELIPEPSVDPDQSGDGSSKTGDSFAGIAALAILGLATTGAVLVRKLRHPSRSKN